MPDTYRQLNIKFIEMHANSEIMGALPEREWIARAPTLKRKRSLAAKVQDEVGHAHLIYRVAETLGKPRQQMYEDLIAGRGKFHNVFHYPTYTWGDVACIGFLVDGAAIVTQRALLETSYAPYVRVMRGSSPRSRCTTATARTSCSRWPAAPTSSSRCSRRRSTAGGSR
jgi:ring-1,2-phenylacetyl-CoA epoxidase subunit PaaA